MSREELIAYLKANAPEKVSKVDEILEYYEGNHVQLRHDLAAKAF